VIRPFNTAVCGTVTDWYLFVGQAGRPIAQLYYCTLGSQCAYGYLARRYYCKDGRICTWFEATKRDREIAACKHAGARFVEHAGKMPHRTQVARYAMGLPGQLPSGLTSYQRKTAEKLHDRCAPLFLHS
jgi:hypothetical protein